MSRSDNNNIQRLSEALQQLNLAESNLRQVIEDINQQDQGNNGNQNPTDTGHRARRQRNQRRSRVLPYSRIRLGDRVFIVNPSEHQQAEGEVIGATIGGYIRVRTDNGNVVRRFPRNLTVQTSQNEQ